MERGHTERGVTMGSTAVSQSGDAQDAHEAAGRLGLLGHGVYYLLLAMLCGRLLLGTGSEETGAEGAVATVARQPFGQLLLGGLTLAFAAYATIRWIRVVRGDDLADRAKNALRASIWTILTALAGNALRSGLQAGGSSGGGGDTGTSITRTVFEMPGGAWLVAAVGLFLAGVAVYQVNKATDGALGSELGELGLDEQRLARWLGRVGYIGRALAYGLVGLFVVHAAVTHDPNAGEGLDGALQQARQSSWGPWLLLAVAVGFAAFGAFRIVEARYSRDTT